MEHHSRKFPNALKKFRRIAGYTQHYVAGLIGHKDATRLSSWENGTVLPTLTNILKLSFIYRTLPQELYPEQYKTIRKEIIAKEPERFKPQILAE